MAVAFKSKGLSKNIFKRKILNKVNLELEDGKILGLLGPNGSGKTTLFKIAAGLLRPSSGSIEIFGNKIGTETKAIVSFLPDVNHLYSWMKVNDALSFYNDFFKDFDKSKAEELLRFMSINKNEKVTSFSQGMLERLKLSLTLSRNAKLYLLDDPLASVDPITRERIIDSILKNYTEDSAVIITTQLIKDIERIFDEIALLHNGELILKGNAEEMRSENYKSINEYYKGVFADYV